MITRHIGLIVAPLALGACSNSSNQDQQANMADWQAARAISVSAVELRPMGGTLQASGLIVPREEVAVSPQLSGYRILQVLVEEGDFVRAGQVLARLDVTLIRSRVDQARAQLAQAEATDRQAAGEAERVRGLDGTGALPGEQIATRRSQAANAAAGVAAARAQLRDLVAQSEQLVIRAPSSGVVLERSARPGGVVSTGGDPLFRLARDARLELDAEVPEDALALVGVGSKAQVALPSGVMVEGTVRRLSPSIDPKTKLGRARIALPGNPQIRSGGFARAEFSRVVQRKPAVPETAIQYDGDGTSVLVIGADSRAHSVAVRTGVRADGWTEILEGPPAGSRVALGGGAFLLDGDRVHIATTEGS
jgi:HlyD family secretion protein